MFCCNNTGEKMFWKKKKQKKIMLFTVSYRTLTKPTYKHNHPFPLWYFTLSFSLNVCSCMCVCAMCINIDIKIIFFHIFYLRYINAYVSVLELFFTMQVFHIILITIRLDVSCLFYHKEDISYKNLTHAPPKHKTN